MTIQFMRLPLSMLSKALPVLRAITLVSLFGSTQLGVAQSLSVLLQDDEGNPIDQAVVEILLPENLRSEFAQLADIKVDQLDKEFVPHVSTVVAGSRVSFPNSDDILHHVYSFSPLNTFNIPLYGKDQQAEYSQAFNDSGVIEIGCNIHDWMLAYVYVAETVLHGASDESGFVKLSNLPAGEFQLRVWHSRLDEEDVLSTRTIALNQGEITEMEITLELQRDRRVRRAPSSSRSRYR
ncbi:MAG: hypothetical protein AB8B95_00530 [Pseudohongiellaceae bacterium]